MELTFKDSIGENVLFNEPWKFNCSCDEDAAVVPINLEEVETGILMLDSATKL